MSVMVVCAVFDSAVQAYARPIFVPSAQVAVRSFTDEVNRASADNGMFNHPDDFELRLLSFFNDESGLFEDRGEAGRVLVRAKDVKK